MSELSEFLEAFPADIQEMAWTAVNGSFGYIDSTEGAVTVARAILAERQRCADVARNATIKYEMDWRGIVEQPIVNRDLIAKAILAPTAP